MAALEFFGAANTVTGSMHLLHIPGGAWSMDCGLYQGRRQEARHRNTTFPIRPDRLEGLILSHAHIDHSGNIPGLVKRGFTGPVHATNATCDLCEVMLADSGHIQEEDARFWNEKRAKDDSEKIEPLYTVEDALKSLQQFVPHAYGVPFEFAPGSTCTFLEAGHILGSACVLIQLEGEAVDGGEPIGILYTGDLGRFKMPILRDPTCPMPEVDYLITESTYANRKHDNPTDMQQRLAKIISETVKAGGKTIIPAFSVGRTQNVVYYLARAIHEGQMPKLPIYVDSPLSTRATEVFKKHPECYDKEAHDFWWADGDIFGTGLVQYITDVDSSKRLNSITEPCVIISASGMCEAGRILHHLKNNIEDEKNTVIVVGYMAQHTLGRRIVERREELKIYGRMYKLMCRVEILNGFSAHADARDLAGCLGPIAKRLKGAYCVHGEDAQPKAMKQILEEAGCPNVQVPKPGDQFQL
ncbi:MAG: MBL fold metallo-hydrolase RNA specificity domain-containing protein [Phycisphaerae bacterium]